MVEHICLRYNDTDIIVMMCESDENNPGVLDVGLIFENKNKNFPVDRMVVINADIGKAKNLRWDTAKALVE